jgi:hypothetical protein
MEAILVRREILHEAFGDLAIQIFYDHFGWFRLFHFFLNLRRVSQPI